jgi:hypothetical protein
MLALVVSLLVKAVAAAAVVVAATYVAERAGPFWGAIVACLPISAGPVYVMLAIDQPAAFIAASALLSFTTNAAMAAFIAIMALLATRWSGWGALLVAIVAWCIGAYAIRSVTWSVGSALLLSAIVYPLCYVLAKRWMERAPAPQISKPRWTDLAMRAVLVGCLSAGVVGGSELLGPETTGVLAVFPVVFTSMAVILLKRLGAAATAEMMVTAMPPLAGLSLAVLVLHLVGGSHGSTLGLLAGLATSLLWSLALVGLRWRQRNAPT